MLFGENTPFFEDPHSRWPLSQYPPPLDVFRWIGLRGLLLLLLCSACGGEASVAGSRHDVVAHNSTTYSSNKKTVAQASTRLAEASTNKDDPVGRPLVR
jgi:hypothetical protein